MNIVELGEYITNTRKKFPMTQAELAEKTGISRVRIGQIERGQANVSFDLIKKIAEALGGTIDVKIIPKD